MDEFVKKRGDIVVINNNKSGLIQARKRKRALIEKDKKIEDLETRLAKLLGEIDPEEDEASLSEWRDDVLDCYAEWCAAKDIPDDMEITHFYGIYSARQKHE